MAQRPPLSLTAELEKLEQSITLTLQEIDHNFSKTHRIVTTSIIPIVERYAKESEAVWEGSKFWKQFFEASANVALSNYQEEEVSYVDQTIASTVRGEATYATHESSEFPNSSPGRYDEHTSRPGPAEDTTRHTLPDVGGGDDDSDDEYLLDDSLLDSLNLTGAAIQSTPKAQSKNDAPQWADIESPFEALKKELTTKDYTIHGFPPTQPTDSTHSSPILPPSTPPTNRARFNRRLPPGADPETPESSPFYPPPSTRKTPGGNPNEDALLHRVLDKNWRVQATPLGKQPASKYRTITQPSAATPRRGPLFGVPDDDDESLMSSPPKPQFHTAHIFDSPPPRGSTRLDLGPKTPTTVKHNYGGPSAAKSGGGATSRYNLDDWDEEDSDDLILPRGYSPPVTIQFSLPPSKLLATPAREASRRIVKDILMTAGAADESGATDSSPPMVRGRMDEDSDDDMF